ncbi:hypothetical protein SCHPADRAFT_854666 [Schizopora paradoxa]|uniref:Tetraspanin Tsp2 n=1 Tax=Schizopora paradoxa TaxID=27342 RepID=A0A0H2S4W3_9AGAM|nr:hypothetical protein SCHPADRAFT_854666 [Schizopora paradoxa]
MSQHYSTTSSYLSLRPYSYTPSNDTDGPGNFSNPTPGLSLSSSTSLSVNFLPAKFSSPRGSLIHKRKGKVGADVRNVKQGGGREAFKRGEARMPNANDDDYDGVDVSDVRKTWLSTTHVLKPKLRWNKFKWILFLSNTGVMLYSVAALVACLLIWFDIWKHADVIRVANRIELVISTVAAGLGILTSLVGYSGLVLNNRSFLAVYNFLLWVTFAAIVAPGYITMRRREFNLQGKLNAQWSGGFGLEGRLRIQNQLGCCGYFDPFIEATVSNTCYARSVLPGCKNAFLKFERSLLEWWYIAVFSLVPLHIAAMFAGLLCSNHVTYRFGKGMMPKAYRLSQNSMAIIIDNYATQLAEQYGADITSSTFSKSNLNVGYVPPMIGYAI